MERLLEEHNVPALPEGESARELVGWVDSTAESHVETALTHSKVRLIADAVSRTAHYANRAQDVAFNAGGLVVGLVNEVRRTREVIYTLVEEYCEAYERLQMLAP